jgi:hypothetical protein
MTKLLTPIATPHVHTLEASAGHKRVDTAQLSFKAEADPYGLLNSSTMRSLARRRDRPRSAPPQCRRWRV